MRNVGAIVGDSNRPIVSVAALGTDSASIAGALEGGCVVVGNCLVEARLRPSMCMS